MSERHDPDPAERDELTEQDLAIATLVGRYVERREQGAAPCAHDLLAVAAEFGDAAVDELRTVLAFYEAMRASRGRRPLTGRPATRGWHALAGVRVGGDRPASGAGHRVQEDQMATTTQQTGRLVALDRIRVPENVRALDEAHVEALAGSIKLQGMLVPLVVRERRRRLRAGRRLSPHRRRALARPGRGAGRRARRRHRGRRPRGREHHAQAAQPLRGGQGRPRDARPPA